MKNDIQMSSLYPQKPFYFYLLRIVFVVTLALVVTSMYYFALSLISSFRFLTAYQVNEFFQAISVNVGLYKFTFISLAAFIGLEQIYRNQLQNNERWNRESRSETFKQCDYYLIDIQIIFRDLFTSDLFNGVPIKYELSELTRDSLEKKYQYVYKKFSNANADTFHTIVLTLFKLDSFAVKFLKGNLDKKLGKVIIGELYCKQIDLLTGAIAYYRGQGAEDEMFMNIVNLRKVWSK